MILNCPRNLLTFCLLGLATASSALVAEYPMLDEIPTRRSITRRQAATDSSDSGSANSTTSHKAGLAWANGNTVDIQPFLAAGKVSWCVFGCFLLSFWTDRPPEIERYYTWSVWPVSSRGSWGSRGKDIELEWVPLFWGAKSVPDYQRNLDQAVKRANESEKTRVRAILGMNE